MMIRKVVSDEDICRSHTLYATVEAHISSVTGWWLWKKNHFHVKVRFSSEQFSRFCQILEYETNDGRGNYAHLMRFAYEVEVGSLEESRQFAVNEEVGVRLMTVRGTPTTGPGPFCLAGLCKKEAISAVA